MPTLFSFLVIFSIHTHTLQVAGGARGWCAVGGEQPRGQVGDPGEGDAAAQETQRRLRGARAEVGAWRGSVKFI